MGQDMTALQAEVIERTEFDKKGNAYVFYDLHYPDGRKQAYLRHVDASDARDAYNAPFIKECEKRAGGYKE